MKRRTSTAPVRVYMYGLPKGPSVGAERIEEQILLAHRYRNELTAIERARREVYRQITSTAGDLQKIDVEIGALTEEIDRLRQEMNAASALARKKVKDPEKQLRIKTLTAERKQLRTHRKDVRKRIQKDPEIRSQIEAMEERGKRWHKAARAACGVYWGTYLLVEDSAEQAGKGKMDPKFRSARRYSDRVLDDGTVGVQLQGGMTVPALTSGQDTRAQLLEPTPHPTHRLLRLRVGSEGRAPIWAEFPLKLHRPLPPDAVIKGIRVQRKREGVRFRWHALFTLEAESLRVPTRLPTHTAAVDVGWRKGKEGLQIAYIRADDGDLEVVTLPQSIIDRLAFANSLRGIRDGHFNDIRSVLMEWMRAHEMPPWFAQQLKHIAHWQQSGKLTALAYRWREERFDRDETIFAQVDEWHRRERHLYQWETGQRRRALNHRREIYRCAAKKLVTAYPKVRLKELDLSKLARRAEPEDDRQDRAARVYRFDAAVSEFRLAVEQAAARYGCTVEYVKIAARDCHACGKSCVWNAEQMTHHICEHCGASWQTDDNECRKMLKAETSAA